MLCNNTFYQFICIFLITFSILSCKEEKKNDISYTNLAEINSSTIYVSNNKQHEFVVYIKPENDNGYIAVHDSKENQDYILKRIDCPDGIKYKSEDDYTLWTKGGEFSWSKDDQLITKGHLKTTEIEIQRQIETSKLNNNNYGNYVTKDYVKKDEGSDWTAVTIKPINDFNAKVSIRSRGDKKNGTCTFDAIAKIIDGNTLKVIENNITILFTFTPEGVSIATDPESDNESLMYFCSGGANLAGNYLKLKGDLDSNQIDKTGYSKSLTYNDVIYNLEEKDSVLTIKIIGFDIEQSKISPIEGVITNAEIDDLNNDTFPEILVYTTSKDGIKGDVIGFSVNNEKSISIIDVSESPELIKAKMGNQGHNEFAMVEGTFIQRFPIYENNVQTGKTRQIQYKMESKEDVSKHLVVDKIVEY